MNQALVKIYQYWHFFGHLAKLAMQDDIYLNELSVMNWSITTPTFWFVLCEKLRMMESALSMAVILSRQTCVWGIVIINRCHLRMGKSVGSSWAD